MLPRIARDLAASAAGPLRFSVDASSRLARQIDAGAPADVFVSADAEWVDWLQARGRIVAATRVELAQNTLVAVVPADRPAVAPPIADLAALAGDAGPAGRAARAALRSAGVWEAAAPHVISADHVRAALAWVASGEVDAGVVSATDARVEPRVRVAFPIPAGAHPPLRVTAAVVAGSPEAPRAAAFAAACRGPAAQLRFAAAGFAPPGGPGGG
ncbi:MAG: molybdate ABC transporter substrate-binding protein [bacterium]